MAIQATDTNITSGHIWTTDPLMALSGWMDLRPHHGLNMLLGGHACHLYQHGPWAAEPEDIPQSISDRLFTFIGISGVILTWDGCTDTNMASGSITAYSGPSRMFSPGSKTFPHLGPLSLQNQGDPVLAIRGWSGEQSLLLHNP